MKKISFILVSIFTLILLVNFVSAQEIWAFDNFVNNYKVYNSATCNVQGTKSCPSELGWQGKSIAFKFKSDKATTDTLKFNVGVRWFISEKPIDIYVNGKKIAENYVFTGNWIPECGPGGPVKAMSNCTNPGEHSFEFSKALLKSGKSNEIKIVMKDIKVGYGKPSQGFVLGRVSLENKA